MIAFFPMARPTGRCFGSKSSATGLRLLSQIHFCQSLCSSCVPLELTNDRYESRRSGSQNIAPDNELWTVMSATRRLSFAATWMISRLFVEATSPGSNYSRKRTIFMLDSAT
jgi:hypothetical protein